MAQSCSAGPFASRCARALTAVAASAVILVGLCAPAPAFGSTQQVSIIQDSTRLITNPAGTLATFRALGASMVRVIVVWAQVAPDPKNRVAPAGFGAAAPAPRGGASDGADPADYPAAGWAPYDEIVKDAAADGIAVDFTLSGGAPRWAEGPGIPAAALDNPFWGWRPSAADFGQFVRAVGTRYSGTYIPPGQTAPLPRVSFWAIWNEPNFGEDLGPQAVDGSTVPASAEMYRALVGQAWNALQATGHGADTILIGETAPRGTSGPATPSHPQGLPGDFGQTRPLAFLRTLYCVNSSYRELRGPAARAVGCPATAAASRGFRAANPGLFDATGFADHPYPEDQPPTIDSSRNADIASFPRLPDLERELDRLQRVYGSSRRFQIYNTEYGYITDPPNPATGVSPATAAYYLNWAEYLSWKQPRVASTMQYLLYDPPPDPGQPEPAGFASGLLFSNGRPKPAYAAYRLPLYLPVTTARRGRALEVWGCVRPARYAILDAGQPQSAQIQFAPGSGGVFAPIQTVTVSNPNSCYFDLRVRFPGSGSVRLAYTYPAAWLGLGGSTVYSRTVTIKLAS
jgi:hypothetical protein